MDIVVNAGAVAYGITLVLASIVRHPLTEAMRIDALFIPQADERTRPLNLLLGLAIGGYGAWSLFSR
ncbi:MAG: hypothetical protein HYX44_12150 [Aquabacterium sp.]|nr:hypothetical protein [Aquabacterium sp.]